MTIVQAIVLGVVQGFTEFLPVSSSGHLIIVPALLGWQPDGVTFDVAVHVATLLAILLALPKEIWRLALTKKVMTLVVIVTVPAVLIGALFGDVFETLRSPVIVGVSLIVWGVVLMAAEWIADGRYRDVARIDRIGWQQALLLGLIQPLAFIPGTSRSGVTMSVGLLAGLKKETAAHFSFLMAIPAIAGAGLVTALDVAKTGLDVPAASLVAGTLAALVSGIAAIKLLYFVIRRSRLQYFGIYRIVLGMLVLWLLS